MRRTFRQLAAVKPSRYLEAGAPTGLAGLLTHPAPRAALIYLYSSTLDKLRQMPESSLYRQSTEALTRHRLSIVDSVEPVGYKEWAAKAEKIMKDHPEVFNTPKGGVAYDEGRHLKETKDGRRFVTTKVDKVVEFSKAEWDGEEDEGAELEGTRSTSERRRQRLWRKERPGEDTMQIVWNPEPSLTVEQIGELETRIAAGLIEEVIQVAEGELKLADVMLQAKVWEDLEEKPVEGQWSYFQRDTGTGTTQQPPQS